MGSYRLVNVVGGGDLGVEVDLHNSIEKLSSYNPDYNPEVSPGLNLKLPESDVAVMVLQTGNYHLTGAENISNLEIAYKELVEIVENELSLEPEKNGAEVRNLVYSGAFDREFNLDAIASDISGDVDYKSSVSHRLLYEFDEKSGVFTLYRTGSFTYTGQNDEKEAEIAIKQFQDLIYSMIEN